MRHYNSFGEHIRSLFGTTVYKVNIDAGFTCPNRDGTVAVGGCIYCNNDSFRPSSCQSTLPIRTQIENGISYLRKRYGAEQFIAYFQPYTNTYAPVEKLEEMYREALDCSDIVGLAIGTRPDCVDNEKIELLSKLSDDYYVLVEYGIQSIYDRTLEWINRGHDYSSFLDAVEMTKSRGIKMGVHVIAGFPSETEDEMLDMADTLSALPVKYMKIHQLQVIRDTLLEKYYRENPFHTFGYEEYIGFIVRFVERLSPEIVLQRLFASAPDDILVAPIWDRGRQQLLRDIDKRFEELKTYQGRLYRADAVTV